MEYRLMATYRGTPYEAGVGPTDSDVVLFAASPPADELGFEPGAGQWRKRVSRDDIDALWESKPVGRYRSQPCLVLDEIGDRLHITHLGHDAYQAERLGYWQVDRGIYEVVVPRDEVTDLTVERVEHPVRRGHTGVARGSAGHEGWNGDARTPDHVASPNGSAGPERTAPRSGEQRSAEDDAPPRPHDELSGGAWMDALDRLPPPRPLPKRRRPAPATRQSASSTVTEEQPAADAAAAAPHGPETPTAGPGAAVPGPAVPGAAVGVSAAGGPAVGGPAVGGPAVGDPAVPGGAVGGRRRRARVETRWVFRDLVDLAAIPHGAYAVDEEVDGALCLIKTDDGYEVFSAVDGTKHEVHFFEDEEAAYFYLFGVLAAEAVRSGRLAPKPG